MAILTPDDQKRLSSPRATTSEGDLVPISTTKMAAGQQLVRGAAEKAAEVSFLFAYLCFSAFYGIVKVDIWLYTHSIVLV